MRGTSSEVGGLDVESSEWLHICSQMAKEKGMECSVHEGWQLEKLSYC
jgi:hypothetical protein